MVKTLAHLFHPQKSNNHRPRILQPAGISVLVGLFLLVQTSLTLIEQMGGLDGFVLGYASNIAPSQIVDLTNQQRASQGLGPLSVNGALNQAAIAKANDMFQNQYWAHVSPSGTTPWVFIKNSGYNYTVAGENLARDFGDSGSVLNAWMSSPTHRDNIVNGKYSEIGVAVVDGILNGTETTLVVQMFGHSGTAVASTGQQAAATEPFVAVVPQSEPAEVPAPVEEEELIVEPPVEEAPELALAESGEPAPPSTTVLSRYSESIGDRSLVSPLTVTKVAASSIVALLVGVLAYDLWVIKRKNLIRLAGKNWAHFGFFGIIIVIIYTMTAGTIL